MHQPTLELYENTKPFTLADLRQAARYLCHRYTYVDADLLRDLVEERLPNDLDRRVIGAVLASRDFKVIGLTKTRRKSSHGRYICRFELRE